MKYKDESGQWKDLVLPATGDTLPVGTVVEFEGDTVPSNWEAVEGESQVIEWDGDTTGRETYSWKKYNYYKVSDLTPTKKALIGQNVEVILSGNTNSTIIIIKEGTFNKHATHPNLIDIAYCAHILTEPMEIEGVKCSAGVYFLSTDTLGRTTKLTFLSKIKKIKKVSQSAGIIAEIEQNLDSNSEVNAPSVKAVKNAIEKSRSPRIYTMPLVLWDGKETLENTGSYHQLGSFYNLKHTLDEIYPNIEGYNKLFKIGVYYSDTLGKGRSTRVALQSLDETSFFDYIFAPTLGDVDSNARRYQEQNFNYDELEYTHYKVLGTPDFSGPGKTVYYQIIIRCIYRKTTD